MPLNPWFGIWVRPRETIRAYLDSGSPQRNMIWLALAAGYLNALDNASSRNMGDKAASMVHIYGGFGLGGAVGSVIFLFIAAWLLKVIGKWLGGEGTPADLQVAIVRGTFMPSILLGVLWIPELLLFGKENFTSQTPHIDGSPLLTLLFLLFGIFEMAGAVWIFVISLKAVGEAHRFSAWRALGTVLISVVIPVAVIVLLIYLLK